MKNMRAILTLILTLTFVGSPFLTSPFSGFTADQLPIPQIKPPIQPAGYAFAIWGVIYVWLVVSAAYGLWKHKDDPRWDRARAPLIVSLAVGTPWLAIANTSAIWATILIFVMMITAIMALLRTPNDRWTFQAPIGLYAGWLTAASFVSLGSTAAGYGILTDQLGWAYIGIICALIVTLTTMRHSRRPAYGLAVVWALVGIVVANGTAPLGVSILAGIGAVVLLGLSVASSGHSVPS
ncbi:TspO/MBR family protein [Yoonia maritima]|uniref:TspO/MBR family protein n=1 Tax=Yoonia maritima TaxID=1435347 RepID=A0A2T0W4A3_9RHOB|nr:tryptophan-rich sensory protein [Yoonia maritima]PRY80308.1 TspO/MBR family protein [Yoonia maritima]